MKGIGLGWLIQGSNIFKRTDAFYRVFNALSRSIFPLNSFFPSCELIVPFAVPFVYASNFISCSVFFSAISSQNVEDHVAFVITVPTALAIFLAVFVLVCIESIFKKLLRVFSLVIWACLVAMGYLFMFSGGIICPWDQVRHVIFSTDVLNFASKKACPVCASNFSSP